MAACPCSGVVPRDCCCGHGAPVCSSPRIPPLTPRASSTCPLSRARARQTGGMWTVIIPVAAAITCSVSSAVPLLLESPGLGRAKFCVSVPARPDPGHHALTPNSWYTLLEIHSEVLWPPGETPASFPQTPCVWDYPFISHLAGALPRISSPFLPASQHPACDLWARFPGTRLLLRMLPSVDRLLVRWQGGSVPVPCRHLLVLFSPCFSGRWVLWESTLKKPF